MSKNITNKLTKLVVTLKIGYNKRTCHDPRKNINNFTLYDIIIVNTEYTPMIIDKTSKDYTTLYSMILYVCDIYNNSNSQKIDYDNALNVIFPKYILAENVTFQRQLQQDLANITLDNKYYRSPILDSMVNLDVMGIRDLDTSMSSRFNTRSPNKQELIMLKAWDELLLFLLIDGLNGSKTNKGLISSKLDHTNARSTNRSIDKFFDNSKVRNGVTLASAITDLTKRMSSLYMTQDSHSPNNNGDWWNYSDMSRYVADSPLKGLGVHNEAGVDIIVPNKKINLRSNNMLIYSTNEKSAVNIENKQHFSEVNSNRASKYIKTDSFFLATHRKPLIFIKHYTCKFIKLTAVNHRKHLKMLNALFPPTSEVDNRHMTLHLADLIWNATHEGIMRRAYSKRFINSVLNNGVKAFEENNNQLKKEAPMTNTMKLSITISQVNTFLSYVPIGTPQNLVIAVFIANFFTKSSNLVNKYVLKSNMLCAPFIVVKDRLKALSTLVRRCAISPDGLKLSNAEVASLAYFEMAAGRSNSLSNWDDEYLNRCTGTVHIQAPSELESTSPYNDTWMDDATLMDKQKRINSDEFYNALEIELYDIASRLVKKRNVGETFTQFMQRRHEWMASGSSAGFKASITVDGIPKKVRGQKRAWSESITAKEAKDWLYVNKPQEKSVASEKNENLKGRAIYGVDPIHYCINTYATKGFEERLHLIPGFEKGATGLTLGACEQRRIDQTNNGDIHCTMLDYADFNRHHTPRAQAMIFEQFAKVGKERKLPNDWVRANLWVAEAKYNMWAKFPKDPIFHKVTQGMFSGTRSTDLINTLLNLAYFNVAKKFVSSHYGIEPIDIYNVHQGDDVWVSNKSKVWAALVYYTLNNMGFIFQDKKQMFGQQRGEYLRVLYGFGSASGYFGRALCNYILRPLQSSTAHDAISWVHTISDSISTLMRRGLTTAGGLLLWENDILYWGKIMAHKKDERPLKLSPLVIMLPATQGGLNAAPPSVMIGSEVSLPDMPLPITKIRGKMSNFPTNMTKDWIQYLSESPVPDYGYAMDAKRISNIMIDQNYSDVFKMAGRDISNLSWKKSFSKYAMQITNRFGSESKQIHDLLYSDNTKTAMNLDDFIKNATPFKPTMRSIMAEMKFASTMNNAELNSNDIIRTGKQLKKLMATSKFKSVEMTAAALNISRQEAIRAILMDAYSNSHVDSEAIQSIYKLLKVGGARFVDMLTSGDCGPAKVLVDFSNAGITQYVASQWFQLSLLCYSGNDNQQHLIQHFKTYQNTLVKYLMAMTAQSTALSRCLY